MTRTMTAIQMVSAALAIALIFSLSAFFYSAYQMKVMLATAQWKSVYIATAALSHDMIAVWFVAAFTLMALQIVYLLLDRRYRLKHVLLPVD